MLVPIHCSHANKSNKTIGVGGGTVVSVLLLGRHQSDIVGRSGHFFVCQNYRGVLWFDAAGNHFLFF